MMRKVKNNNPKLSFMLLPGDMAWRGWEKVLAESSAILMMHGSPSELRAWRKTHAAMGLIERLEGKNVEIEYCMHVCSDILPRSLFRRRPELFRMDEQWRRTPDANLCVSNPDTIEIIAKYLKPILDELRPTTDRYHLAADDNRPWCFCGKCRELSFPDQNLSFVNMLAKVVKVNNPKGKVSYIAYKPAIDPPTLVKPEKNVFLDFAPIERDYVHSLVKEATAKDTYYARVAAELIRFFGAKDSQVLEYWLDVSMFSHWMKPARRIPVKPSVIRADLDFYRKLGFSNITTFATWIDAGYVRKFGRGSIDNFLRQWNPPLEP